MEILLGEIKIDGESKEIYLKSDSRNYSLATKEKDGKIYSFSWFTSLEYCFRSFTDLKIRTSIAIDFAMLIDINIEAIKEIKKCVKEMQGILQLNV